MKQVFTTSNLRSLLTFLSFPIVVHAIAQPKLSDELPLNAYYLGIDGRSTVLKTTVDSLIALHDSPVINDTDRVSIVLQLGEYECVRCVEFLLDNLARNYDYGDNNSDYDLIRRQTAFFALFNTAIDPDRGWYLFPHLLYSLKKQKRNEPPLYYLRLYYLLSCFSSNSEIMKSIIDNEIIREYQKKRLPFSRRIYVENLNLMLKTYEEDQK